MVAFTSRYAPACGCEYSMAMEMDVSVRSMDGNMGRYLITGVMDKQMEMKR